MVAGGANETSENPTVTVSALPATAETGAAGCDTVISVDCANALSGAPTKKRATSSPRRNKLVDIFFTLQGINVPVLGKRSRPYCSMYRDRHASPIGKLSVNRKSTSRTRPFQSTRIGVRIVWLKLHGYRLRSPRPQFSEHLRLPQQVAGAGGELAKC